MSVEKIHVTMKLDFSNSEPPSIDLNINDQVRIRNFTNLEIDKNKWIEILLSCNEVNDETEGENRFNELYGEGVEQLRERMLFIENTNTNEVMGTVTAWHRELDGVPIGYIHWLSVSPNFQKNGYSKLLLAKALEILSTKFDGAFLKTANTNYVAIALYLKFGFRPVVFNDDDELLWENIKNKLNFLNKC
jgi:ribosomal protein S18 acetylase RimI-like enzyme